MKNWLKTQHTENQDHGNQSVMSWQIDGETVKTVTDFILGGSKITADDDCSHDIKRRFLLGRKVMANLDSILKSRDITLATMVCIVKAMVFPVGMYQCENWAIKKAAAAKSLQSPSSVIWETKKIKPVTVSMFPYLLAMKRMGMDAMILGF